ncbi:MAG: sulfite exporter TauE/SafE family protein [Parachlamydia sp.]
MNLTKRYAKLIKGSGPICVSSLTSKAFGRIDMHFSLKGFLWLAVLAIIFMGYSSLYSLSFDKSFVVLILVSFFCEFVDSGLGMGYGTILTSTLLLMGYHPLDIVPTILLSELFTGFASAYFHDQIENVDLKFNGVHFNRAVLLAATSMVGLSLGVYTVQILPENLIIMLIGCIVFISGLFVVVFANQVLEYRNWKMALLAIVAAFNKAISGGGYGPLVTSGQILSGVQGKSAVGITSFAEAFTCLLSVILFRTQGEFTKPELLAPMLFGALSSVPFSVFLISKFNENYLKRVIGFFTMLLGFLLFLKIEF